MIKMVKGDILKQDAEALVNTVNCVGVMGRGVALQFRKAYPENYEAYCTACNKGKIQPGRMFVYPLKRLANPRLIINFPTKKHWRGSSHLDYIRDGLKDLVSVLQEHKVRSVAIPPLGCGLGGLDWRVVHPLIEQALREMPDVEAYLFEPGDGPLPDEMVKQKSAPNLTIGRAALLALMGRYLGALMDVSVSLLEIHKLMYFMQEAGEPLRLRFRKAMYGPYAENLRHVLSLLEGHFIMGYGEGEDAPDKQIELLGDAIEQGERLLEQHPKTSLCFGRVCDLIMGFETPFGMELLATVHWVAVHERAGSLEQVIASVYAWNERKRMFTADQIETAWETLHYKGWFDGKAA